VAAESPELAARAVDLIEVDYEVREPITDMERALAPDAPKLHAWGNVVRHLRIEHGDPEVDADVWVDGYYGPLGRTRPRSGLKAGSPCLPRTAGSTST
jgi:CO/xanthine dehydrogenase Mo-binding subunit